MVELPTQAQVFEFVSRRENREVLEYCLKTANTEFEYLQRLRKSGQLSFGPLLTPSKAQEIFPEIAKEVKHCVGIDTVIPAKLNVYHPVQEIKNLLRFAASLACMQTGLNVVLSRPLDADSVGINLLTLVFGSMLVGAHRFMNHGKASYYDSKRHSLEIAPIREKKPTTIAHEYTHHLQAVRLSHIPFSERKTISEGHAEGVSRIVCEALADKYDDPTYRYESVSCAQANLTVAYILMHMKRWDTINSGLVARRFSNTKHYAVGYAAFRIAEELQGQSVYKDVFIEENSRKLFK